MQLTPIQMLQVTHALTDAPDVGRPTSAQSAHEAGHKSVAETKSFLPFDSSIQADFFRPV